MKPSTAVSFIIIKGIACLLVASLLCGCVSSITDPSNGNLYSQGGTPSDTEISEDDITQEILSDPDLDENIRELLVSKADRIPQTIYEIIDHDVDSNIISKEEGLLHKLNAAYFPDRLKDKYRSQEPGQTFQYAETLRRDIQWAINHFDSIDSDYQKIFRPFILRPDDPDSFYNPATTDKNQPILEKIWYGKPAFADEQPMQSLDFSVPGKPLAGTIYYHVNAIDSDEVSMEQKALEVKEACEKAWPMFKDLLNAEPTDKVVLYIVDLHLATSHQAGAAYYIQDKTTKKLLDFYIKLDWSLSGSNLKSVAVHELFHIFQYHVMNEYEALEAWWLQEATAVWAENYVYPLTNREHGYLDVFFSSLDTQMINKGGAKEYAGYMFFFYLLEKNFNDRIAADIILGSKGNAVANYMMSTIPDFPAIYAQFALWNWNADPWKKYSDHGTFPPMRPYGAAIQEEMLREGMTQTDNVFLSQGSIVYRYYHVGSENIRRIRFDFSEVPWDGDVSIQALYKIGDQWVNRDCTEQSALIFCKNKPSENVKGVVLIFSNADIETPIILSQNPLVISKEPVQISIEVDTTGECPESINGYTRITETMTYHEGNASAEMVVIYESIDELEYDEARKAYVIIKRALTYTLYSDKNFPDTAVFGLGGNDTTANGTIVETYDLLEAPVRFFRERNEGISFIPDPETKQRGWVLFQDSVLGSYNDDPLSFTFQYLGERGGMDILLDELHEDGFSGSRKESVNVDDNMVMETTIEFSYNFD